MSQDRQLNICGFKKVCIACTKVALDNRPSFCEALECEEYKPCPGCKMNRTLHEHNNQTLCKQCHATSEKLANKLLKEKTAAITAGQQTISTGTNSEGTDAAFGIPSPTPKSRVVDMTPPGVPPPQLTDGERKYYEQRWLEFKGYYRNPAAYFVCHTMILEEIHLTYLNQKQIECRGEMQAAIANERSASLGMLSLLNKQLPEKESEDVADDEKSIGMIYQRYIELKGKRTLKGVSRVFTDEALALAPSMTFPIDPVDLLERCGYKIVDPKTILDHITFDDKIAGSKTQKEILEFFGFRLDEKFAMPYGDVVQDPEDRLAEDE